MTDQPSPTSSAPRALDALAAVIAEFNADRPLETSIALALEAVRRSLDAHECSLWLHAADGLVRTWAAGEALASESAVQAALAADGAASDLCTVRVLGANRHVGALVVRVDRPLLAEDTTLLHAVANLLAPELAHAERSRQLEVEVAARTAEIDRERRFTEKIIDSMPVGLYVIDRQYRIQAWNRKRETGMQGIARDEALGRTIFDVLHRQPFEMLRREFDEVFATGRIQEYQMESTASGDQRTYRITKVPMRLGDSAVTHVITIGEDVTDWREGQQRYAQAEKLAAIGTLAAGVMHEINNPLATIAACGDGLGYRLEDLQRKGVEIGKDLFDYIEIVENEVLRCKQIVDQLLDFSRPKQLAKSPVDLNEVVEKMLFLMKHHGGFKKMNLVKELEPNLPVVPRGNAEQLVQVLMALIINATDATGGHGTITLRTRTGPTPTDGAIVEVTDTGHGIARAELSKIFEPFYTTKAPGTGTGLGLAICYGIVQDHRGRIEVDSVVGKGSTFRVLLPTVEW
ncbi:MAG: PAS domain-containing protein [Gemmatimonadetes bacterium]|nr:PAS domain-containing protein [Gemmatimonadota bacterium]